MSLVEHLTELRRRLIVSLAAIALGAVVAFALYERILDFLISPYCDVRAARDIAGDCSLVITDPLEAFATRLKVGGYTGLLLASPVVLFQLWRFITPGLYPKEKRYAIPFVLSSIVLFLVGATIALLTFPKALDFLIAIGGSNIQPLFSPAKYLGLIVLMIVAFGVAFEFPIVLIFLELAGVLTSRKLLSWWRPAVVIIFAVAAIITPSQDPYSLFAMALPMTLFYGIAIGVGKLLKR